VCLTRNIPFAVLYVLALRCWYPAGYQPCRSGRICRPIYPMNLTDDKLYRYEDVEMLLQNQHMCLRAQVVTISQLDNRLYRCCDCDSIPRQAPPTSASW
jgi:hypothetical protein